MSEPQHIKTEQEPPEPFASNHTHGTGASSGFRQGLLRGAALGAGYVLALLALFTAIAAFAG